jgi:ASPIC and UnbV/FG-GAP-like repeat
VLDARLVEQIPVRARAIALDELPRLAEPVLPQPDEGESAERARCSADGDDWETEKLHDRALPVLRDLLAALLRGKAPEPAGLAQWLAEPFEGAGDLRPAALVSVFDDGAVQVLESGSADPPSGDVQRLCASALRWREALGAEAAAALPLVVSLVPLLDGRFETRVLLDLQGRVPQGIVQVNARWLVGWSTRAGGPPRVSSIAVESYQEVRAARALFDDATEAVFGGDPWWSSEFLRGVDDWHMRIDRAVGSDYQGMQGLAVGDVDNDGLEDVYVCQQAGLPNRLFVHQPDGRALERGALAKVGFLDATASALIVDFDGDGWRDLALGVGSEIVLAHNEGRGLFALRAALRSASSEPYYSLSAGDGDGDGDLDLFGCRYAAGGVMSGAPSPYHDARNGAPNVYWRNDGAMDFSDATAEAGFEADNRRFSTTSLWEDIDDDGDLDLLVVNDFGRNNLWRNDGRGHFQDAAGELGLDGVGAGMGASLADYDLDGDLDLYLSNMFSAVGLRTTSQARFLGGRRPDLTAEYQRHALGNTLLARQADGTYADVSAQAGVNACGWAWGAVFCDFDSDGYADLYVPNGMLANRRQALDLEGYFWRRVVSNSPVDDSTLALYRRTFDLVNRMAMYGGHPWNGSERNNAFLNLGNGRFAEVGRLCQADQPDDSRAVAALDWDDDGRQDLLVRSRTAPRLRLLLNRCQTTHRSVAVELVSRAPNADAIGARVTATVGGRARPLSVHAGEGYLCQASPRLAIGLAHAEQIDALEVRWPDGARESFGPLGAGRRWRVEQGTGQARERLARPATALIGLESVPAQRDPTPVDRVVLGARLPMAPFHVAQFDRAQRRVQDFDGRALLIYVWSAQHESGPAALADLAAAAPAFEALGVDVVCLSVDEGLALTRARKLIEGTPLGRLAGYLDGAAREQLRLVLLEILGFFDGAPLPSALLLDRAGQACALYLGPPDLRALAADAAIVRDLNLEVKGTLRLTGGSWLRPPRRDLKMLAGALEVAGFEDLARFYKGTD